MKRGASLFGSSLHREQRLLHEQTQQNTQQKNYTRILQNLQNGPSRLKHLITKFRSASTQEQQLHVYKQFRKQQLNYRRLRVQLSDEFDQIKTTNSHKDHEYVYVRNQLIQYVRHEMSLDLEMNQLIQNSHIQKPAQQLNFHNLQARSPQVQNALDDLLETTQQILQLQACIQQCLDLLKTIGVLTEEQGHKIKVVQDEVTKANQSIQEALKLIDIEKFKRQRNNRRKCWIILIGLIVIALILVLLYGFALKNL